MHFLELLLYLIQYLKCRRSDPLLFQIFGASLVFVMLYKLFENARKLEERIKKVRQA